MPNRNVVPRTGEVVTQKDVKAVNDEIGGFLITNPNVDSVTWGGANKPEKLHMFVRVGKKCYNVSLNIVVHAIDQVDQ